MSILSFVRPAWRSLRRTPAFTVTALVTLVVGMGAAVAIFALVNGVLLQPLAYANPDRLVGSWHDMSAISIRKGTHTSATYFTYKNLAKSIEGIGVVEQTAVNVSDPRGGTEPQRITAALVTASLIPVLGVPPLFGRGFTEAEDRPNGASVILISEGLWRSRFGGDRQVLGRTLDVNGRTREIIGVMPSRFRYPAADTHIWLPLQLDPAATFYGGFNYEGIARLKPGVTPADAEREFAALLPRMGEQFPNMAPGVPNQMVLDQAKPKPLLIPLKQDLTGGIARTLWILAAASGLVLLVACANVTNLILVRADARQRELAVREAIGAGRGRVLAHFLAESVLITAAAAALGLALATVAIRTLVRMGPAEIPRLSEVSIDAVTVAFAIAIAVIVAFACSIIPALRIGGVHLATALREGGRSGTASRTQQRVRSVLVVSQIALALVALAGSGVLIRTFQQLNAVRPGFNPANLATFWISLPQVRYPNDTVVVGFHTQLLDRVRRLPGVEAAGMASRLPLVTRAMNQNPLFPEGDPSFTTKLPPLQIFTTSDGDYFRTMGIPLLAGKVFDRLDVQRPGEAVISQATAVQFWKDSTGQQALGKRFRDLPGGTLYTVIGVVGDVRDTALASPPSQTAYFAQVPKGPDQLDTQTRTTMALVVRTAGDPSMITSAVQRTVRDLDPSLPVFDVRAMTAVFRESMAQLRFTMLVLGAAAVVTLLLGAVGLYGVMAYIVALRTKELGVRIALGASPGSVVAMLTRQGVVLTAAGIGVGLILFAVVARFLRSLLYGVAATDPLTLVSASLLLIATAALASWTPARRTSRLDPADVLRAE